MINILKFLALVSVVAQLTTSSDAAFKDSAMKLMEKAADVADKTPEVPQEGGVRSTIAHTAVDLAMNKGIDVLAKSHPTTGVALKLAKPVVAHLHKKINNYFAKPEDAPTTPAPDGSTKPAANAETSPDPTVSVTTAAPESGGLMSKIKSAVGLNRNESIEKPIEGSTEKPTEASTEEEPKKTKKAKRTKKAKKARRGKKAKKAKSDDDKKVEGDDADAETEEEKVETSDGKKAESKDVKDDKRTEKTKNKSEAKKEDEPE